MAKRKDVRGKDYFENAAKQIPWPVDVGAKSDDYKGQIHVPHFDIDRASDHLMVKHLLGLGYTIQSTIAEVSQTKIFDPVMNMLDKQPIQKEVEESKFKIGDRFLVKSTGQKLEITSLTKGITLHYYTECKEDVKMPSEHLDRNLSFQTWIRL